VVEGAQRWWTVVLVNWDDEPLPLAAAVAALGIPGGAARYTATTCGRASACGCAANFKATLAPHTTLTVALAGGDHPQVIGTTRHVIQGAIDITDERWTLRRARSA